MRRSGSLLPVAFVLTSLAVLAGAGCSSSGGTGAVSHAPTPAPTESSLYNTMGTITCSAPDDAVPGYYINIYMSGTVTGSTLVMNDNAFSGYQMVDYAVGATPAPTAEPIVAPTPAPGVTPSEIATLYYGEYTTPAYVDPASQTMINPTTGCFQLLSEQPIGSTAGQSIVRRTEATSDTADADGLGNPVFAAPQPGEIGYVNVDGAGSYPFTALTITNLTRTTGTGTFTLEGGTNGSLTVTGSVTSPSLDEDEDSAIFRSVGAVVRRR